LATLRQSRVQAEAQIAASRHFEVNIKGFFPRLANLQIAWPHFMTKDNPGKGEDNQKSDDQT
jgi:hypothetical protein